jgi:hypothetical protein
MASQDSLTRNLNVAAGLVPASPGHWPLPLQIETLASYTRTFDRNINVANFTAEKLASPFPKTKHARNIMLLLEKNKQKWLLALFMLFTKSNNTTGAPIL